MLSMIIADDQDDLLDDMGLLCSYLEVNGDKLNVVGLCKNGFEALDALLTTRPDFALLDIEMPGINGVEVAKKARQMSPNTKNIICSGHADRYSFAELARSGVQAYLLKPFSPEKLVVALQEVLKGQVWCDPLMVNRTYQKLVDDYRELEATRSQFTPFEQRLLELLGQGLDQNQIADQLKMNKNTVKTHLRSLRQKCDCKDLKVLRAKIQKFNWG